MQERVADKFGDNGIIGVVVAEQSESGWHLPIWLMSCRVLNRRVEEGILNKLVAEVVTRGGRSLSGTYLPSAKNSLVREHYAKLGFQKSGEAPEGRTDWVLDVTNYAEKQVPFQYI